MSLRRQPSPKRMIRRPGAGLTFAVFYLLLCVAVNGHAQQPVLGDYWAHDPSTIVKDGGRYYVFRTSDGIMGKWSTDLRNWNYAGQVFPSGPPSWTTNAVPAFGGFFWAPDVAYFNGNYHLYYSISSWGSINSAIGLVTSPSLASPAWTDRGKVVQSDPSWAAGPNTDTTAFNCIDPSILQDTNGTIWMVFGSYFDGIVVTEIDPATGKRVNSGSIGAKIASSSGSFSGNTTEAAYLHQRGGYYYLFLNYGRCCAGIDSTYNIRIGRSTSVIGPYLDKDNVNMLVGGGSVVFESTGRQIGPGHAGILVENGTNWLTYHYYDGNDNGVAKLGLTQLHWTADGWPAITDDWSAFYTFDVDGREHRAQYDGSLRNGASVASVPGRGQVLELSGASEHADLPITVANASTYAAWVKWAGGGTWQRIFDFGDGTGRYLFLTPRAENGKLRFAITLNGNDAESIIDAPFPLPTNTWSHVAVTLDGTHGFIYLNGNPVATNDNLTLRPWQVLARSNYIGRSQWPDPFFAGQIDSFRVFSRALTPAEIKNLAYAHPGLAHRYSFASGPADSIGMAHGTLMGNAVVTNQALQLTGTFGGYVSLPGGLVSGSSAVTIEFWAEFGSNGDWVRVFDFGNTSGSNGDRSLFYCPRTSFGGQRLGLFTAEGDSNLDLPGVLDGRTLHMVCILDPASRYSAIYTNGVLRSSQTTTIPSLSGIGTAWSFIGRSLFAGDPWLNATIDEFRIYDGRLTSQEIATSYAAGPDSLPLSVPLTATRLSGTSVVLSWPAYALGFVPEMSSDPGGPWSPIPATPTLANDRWSVVVPGTESAKFFKLKR